MTLLHRERESGEAVESRGKHQAVHTLGAVIEIELLAWVKPLRPLHRLQLDTESERDNVLWQAKSWSLKSRSWTEQ